MHPCLTGAFAFLNANDLGKCARVCAGWKRKLERLWNPGRGILAQMPRRENLRIGVETVSWFD